MDYALATAITDDMIETGKDFIVQMIEDKLGYHIGYNRIQSTKISNLTRAGIPELQENVESNDFYHIFDKIYFSHKIGLKKPGKEFFEYVLKENNLNPEECIFIDDAPKNIDAANELGFKGILFLSSYRLEENLKKILDF